MDVLKSRKDTRLRQTVSYLDGQKLAAIFHRTFQHAKSVGIRRLARSAIVTR